MITPATAELAVSIAKGLIKLAGRLDALLAEKHAVTGDLILPMPPVSGGPTGVQMVKELQRLLKDTAERSPDPLGKDREKISALLDETPPDPALVQEFFAKYFPDAVNPPVIKPDAQYLVALRKAVPTLDLSDEDTRLAAFYVASGRDDRQIGYGMRIGLLVVDVLAEFGAENTGLFLRDARVRSVVQSVLERFSKPELEDFDEWSPLLRHALSATLNGVFDARAALLGDSQWLTLVLDVLAEARAYKEGGDDFLLGLFQGRGYRLLISKGLARAAEVLAEDSAEPFKQIAAEVLKTAAPLAAKSSFRNFFSEHWGDLLRAGLSGLEKQGPKLLEGQSPLLQTVLVAMVGRLAETPNAQFLSSETLFRLTDAAIAAVAKKPELLTGGVKEPWLEELLNSFISTVGRQGIRLTFSEEGLEGIITDAAGAFAQHPELIIARPGLLQEVVLGILKAVRGLNSLDAKSIAGAAVQGSLQAIADHPALLDTRYANLIADFAGSVAKLVEAKTLTGLEASAIVSAAVESMLRNPILFDEAEDNLAGAVLDAVLGAAGQQQVKLIAGATLVATLREVLLVIARNGKPQVSQPMDQFTSRLTEVVVAGLKAAEAELGHRLDMPAIPQAIAGLVGAWARGELATLDPNTRAFQDLFAALCTTVKA